MFFPLSHPICSSFYFSCLSWSPWYIYIWALSSCSQVVFSVVATSSKLQKWFINPQICLFSLPYKSCPVCTDPITGIHFWLVAHTNLVTFQCIFSLCLRTEHFINISNADPCRENLSQLRMDLHVLTAFPGFCDASPGVETTCGNPQSLPDTG